MFPSTYARSVETPPVETPPVDIPSVADSDIAGRSVHAFSANAVATPPRRVPRACPDVVPPTRESRSLLGTAAYRGWPMSSEIRVDHGRMLDVLEIEGQLLTAATQDAHADSPVPGVSGRTVGETVRDAGDRCEDALFWMGSSGAVTRGGAFPADAGLRETTSRFTARLAELLAEFAMRPPGDPCLTWWPEEHSVDFWLRRTTHATTLSRVDVQMAVGIARMPIDADLAMDGIDELLGLWLDYRLHALGITPTRVCSVTIHAGDSSAWHVAITLERASVTRFAASEAPRADGVVVGDPSAVQLWLWGRLPNRSVELTGDQDAIAQLWGLLRLATQ